MEPVDITVEELQGDVDTSDIYLTTPADVIPGGGDPGKDVTATVVTIFPGLSFLAISQDQGDTPLQVEELNTGHPDVDTHRYLVASKDVIPYPDGTGLTGYVFQATNGPVLLVQLPATEVAAPPVAPTA